LSRDKQKEEEKEQATQAATLTKEFMSLCRENELDIKSFAKFSGVDSSKVETIRSAIENFESLKESFLEVSCGAA